MVGRVGAARGKRALRAPRLIHPLLVAGAVLTVLGAIVLPINLAAIPRLSRKAAALRGARYPRVSVIIPARNEENEVERAVRSHLAQDYPDLQVVVVNDRSTDRTGEILRALNRKDPRLIVVDGREPPEGWLGKPHALWQGAQVAGGEVLLFADADVRYHHPRTLSEAVAVLEEGRLDLLAFFPKLEMRGFWENVLLPYLAVGVFLGFGFIAAQRRIRGLALGAGVGNLVRRRAYDAVGGHAALRNSVVDDVRLAIELKRAGFSVVAMRAVDRVTVRIYHGFRGVWNGFTKNIAWAFPGAGGVVFFALTILLLVVSVTPAGVLVAAALGAPLSGPDVSLAAALFAATIVLRAALAAALSDPLWPAATHPIMAAVWAGLLGRSLIHRYVRKRLTWRGREYDARRTRF